MPPGFTSQWVGKATREEVERLAQRLKIEKASARRIASMLDGQLQNVLDDVDKGRPLDEILRRFDDTPELRASLERALIDAAEYGVEVGIEQAGIGMDWTLVNQSAREWAGRYSYELVRQIDDRTRDVLRKEIPRWAESGEPLKQLAKDLHEKDGAVFSKYRAQMVAQTETTRAYAEGNIQTWRASGVIKRKKWMTANDEIAARCPICGPVHGEVVGIDDVFSNGKMNPPGHPNCRCFVTPVVGE